MSELKKCANCGREYRGEKDFLTGTTRWRTCSSGHLWFNCSCTSTLIITKGKFDWYAPDKVMGHDAATVFNKLSTLRDLPRIPSQVLEVQRLVNDPKSDPKDIALAIKQDPITAAQLLAIAENIRSSRNPGNPPVKSLEHSIVYLGIKAVGELIMTSAIRQFKFPDSTFSFDDFWHESHLCGAITEYLNASLKLDLNQDEVYLAASMCNLGKLVTAYSFPALASKIQNDVKSPKESPNWRQAEESYRFPDHRILGEVAVSLWGLPVYIAEASRRHHDPLSPNPKFQMHELVAIANQLVHWVLLVPSRIESGILDSFYAKLGRSEKDFELTIRDLQRINENLKVQSRQSS